MVLLARHPRISAAWQQSSGHHANKPDGGQAAVDLFMNKRGSRAERQHRHALAAAQTNTTNTRRHTHHQQQAQHRRRRRRCGYTDNCNQRTSLRHRDNNSAVRKHAERLHPCATHAPAALLQMARRRPPTHKQAKPIKPALGSQLTGWLVLHQTSNRAAGSKKPCCNPINTAAQLHSWTVRQ